MHISEGVLSAGVLATGGVLAAGGLAVGLRRMRYSSIPEVAVLSSTFFVASLIRLPLLGPVSMHATLNGLAGLLLGWMAFPSIFVALALQALLFQFGGLTTLGVNTLNMALPAVAVYYIAGPLARRGGRTAAAVSGFLAGFLGVLLGAIMIALCLVTTGEAFGNVAGITVAAHAPVAVVEGVFTSFCVVFLRKVKPEVLEAAR